MDQKGHKSICSMSSEYFTDPILGMCNVHEAVSFLIIIGAIFMAANAGNSSNKTLCQILAKSL